MNRSGRPCLSKMIWTKINSNLIHMFAPQLICPSTKLPFRQLLAVQCDAKGILRMKRLLLSLLYKYFPFHSENREPNLNSLKLVNWQCLLNIYQSFILVLKKKNGYDRNFWLFFPTFLTPDLLTWIFEFFSNKFIAPNLKTYYLLTF